MGVVSITMLMHKKAVSQSEIVVVVLLALAVAVVVIMITSSSGKKLNVAAEIVTSCRDQSGTCDCYYERAACPPGTTMVISSSCPKIGSGDKCDDKSIDAAMRISQKSFTDELKSIEKEIKGSLKQDELLILKYRYFGRCCIGAEKPAQD